MANERTVPAIRAMLEREFPADEVAEFIEKHRENPHVFKAFEEEAINRIRCGKQRLSSKGIIEFLRDNQSVQTTGMKGFNISNTYTAYYSRIFCHLHPIHRHLWQFNETRQKQAA